MLGEVIRYSKEYLDYIVKIPQQERFGLEYTTGINMQTLLDIYNMSQTLRLDSVSTSIEPDINNYYRNLYQSNRN